MVKMVNLTLCVFYHMIDRQIDRYHTIKVKEKTYVKR